MALIGGAILLFLYMGALFAGFIAPYSYLTENRKEPYHPPTPLHFVDDQGNFSFNPFVYNYTLELKEGERTYTTHKEKKYYLKLFVRGAPYKFLGLFPSNIHLFGVAPPADLFILGSDWNGRDILSRIIHGSRISLSIGLLGVAISLSLGLIVGALSGYYGGRTDTIIMRIVELLMSFPSFYFMLALRATFPLAMPSITVYLMIVTILAFLGWPGLARVIRGMTLSLKQREYILATKALGGGTPRILFRHLLPQTFSYALVAATLSIPAYILGESALSLLGLGIMEPYASWGNMLKRAMSVTEIQLHPWILFPGAFIFITVMAFNFVGDGLRDVLDPRAVITGKMKK